jgi:hypothetical protein
VSSRVPWRRFLVEGAVIVVSILFAFGIDAWWAERQERRVLLEVEERLRAQMSENRAFLITENRRASEAVARLDAVSEAISPQPEPMPSDSLVRFLTPGLIMQEVELEVSAVDELLTSASLDLQGRSELYRLLVAYRTRVDRYGRVIPGFIEARSRVYDRLYSLSPSRGRAALHPGGPGVLRARTHRSCRFDCGDHRTATDPLVPSTSEVVFGRQREWLRALRRNCCCQHVSCGGSARGALACKRVLQQNSKAVRRKWIPH